MSASKKKYNLVVIDNEIKLTSKSVHKTTTQTSVLSEIPEQINVKTGRSSVISSSPKIKASNSLTNDEPPRYAMDYQTPDFDMRAFKNLYLYIWFLISFLICFLIVLIVFFKCGIYTSLQRPSQVAIPQISASVSSVPQRFLTTTV